MHLGEILNYFILSILSIEKMTIFAPLINRGRVPQINQ